MVMLLFAAMVAMLLASFVVSMKTVALAMLGASFIALLIHRRGRSKAGELNSPKPLILAGGVLIVGMATLVVEMYLVIDAELAPTREAVSKTKRFWLSSIRMIVSPWQRGLSTALNPPAFASA